VYGAKLQGYLFFATAYKLLEEIKAGGVLRISTRPTLRLLLQTTPRNGRQV
jgi:hypothetical protein